ncbi:MAG: VanZ family protein [Oscillospiraceae bacterium]
MPRQKQPPKLIVMKSIAFAYLILVVGSVVFPIKALPLDMPRPLNLIPFHTIWNLITSSPALISSRQIAVNIAIFLPFGFLVPFLTKKNKFIKALVGSVCFSIILETLKYTLGYIVLGLQYRSVDIDYVILNLIGTALGYGLFMIFPHFIKDTFLPVAQRKRIEIYRPEIVFKNRK